VNNGTIAVPVEVGSLIRRFLTCRMVSEGFGQNPTCVWSCLRLEDESSR
jgi:hypothetical protein